MKIRASLRILGAILIFLSIAAAVVLYQYTAWAKEQTELVTSQLEQIIPGRFPAVEDEYEDAEMPVLQINGRDYVCLLEVPSYSIALPVQSEWMPNNLLINPCRYTGSPVDGTLILGGSSGKGQFDFCAQVDVGEKVTVTDMQGNCFEYSVKGIERWKELSAERLRTENLGLTLFTKESFSSSYIVVKCEMK